MRRWIHAGSAILGGAAWATKAVAILVSGAQPPVLFEVGPFFFGVACVGLARSLGQLGAAWVSAAGGLLAVGLLAAGQDVFGGPMLGVSVLLALVVLVWRGLEIRGASTLPLALGALTVPAVFVGGALAEIDERLLEAPLLLVALGWMWLGAQLARGRFVPPEQTRGGADAIRW